METNENTAYHLAQFYVKKKAWNKAKTILKNYLLFSRDWTLYAIILEGLKEADQAMEALQKAIELDAYNSAAWVQQGLLLEHQKQWEKATEAYQKALALDHALIVAHEGLSNVLMAQGQFPVALEHTRYVIQQNPNHFPSLYKLAILLEQTEDFEEALGLYFKLLVLKPSRQGLEKRIETSIMGLSKKKKHLAKKFAKGWMINFPKSELAKKVWDALKVASILVGLFMPAFGYCAYNDKQESLTWEIRHAELGDPLSQFNVGQMFETGNNMPKSLEKAISYYKRAASQGHIGANMALGRIYEKSHGINEAMQYYLKAAEGGHAPAQLIVSRHLQAKGKLQQALEWLKKALKQLFPNTTDFSLVSPEYKKLKEMIQQHLR